MLHRTSWTSRQFQQHCTAARLLEHVREMAWSFLRGHPRGTERQVQEFILMQFRRCRLRLDADRPMVAFRQHTGEVHYFPPRRGSLRLRPNSWVLLDLWARLDQPHAPYADITWMAYRGRAVPRVYLHGFRAVRSARDAALNFLRREVAIGHLPTGHAVDAVARRSLNRAGFRGAFLHTLGHSLGLNHPHGRPAGFSPRNREPIAPGIGYTIEPGVYLSGRFGARLEMDCFVTTDRQVFVTTELQHEVVHW